MQLTELVLNTMAIMALSGVTLLGVNMMQRYALKKNDYTNTESEYHNRIENIIKAVFKYKGNDQSAGDLQAVYNRLYEFYLRNTKKVELHKLCNFMFKQVVLFFLLCIPYSLIFMVYNQLLHGKEIDGWNTVISYLLVILPPYLLAFSVSRYIEVMKFQETWSRHKETKVKIEIEALKYQYLTNVNKISGDDKRQLEREFILEITKIMENDLNKFTSNMENKEKGMLDDIQIKDVIKK